MMPSIRGRRWFGWVGLTLGLVALTAGNLLHQPKYWGESRMSVAMPAPAQVLLSGGDRYLAANAGVWRALMVGIDQLPPETLKALAMTQVDVSFLNPAHEDNYYTATAILPWEGEVERAQTILKRAIEARPHDAYPPFYYGFNQLHFRGDARGAAEALRAAALRVRDDGMRQALTVLAAQWTEKGEDLPMAIATIATMAERSKDKSLRAYLMARVQRLEGLLALRQAASRYLDKRGQFPASLAALVDSGELDAIPSDPLGGGYSISQGTIVANPPRR